MEVNILSLGLIVFAMVMSSARLEDSGKDYSVADEKCKDENFDDCSGKKCGDKDANKVIVCYFTNWSGGRDGKAKFTPHDIDPSQCTHILYAFASLDNHSLTIVPSDPDTDKKLYRSVTDLKSETTQVLLSMGGWGDSTRDKWTRLINSPNARATFVQSLVEFLKKHNFDGLDMDYEYPGCPQGEPGTPTDSGNFNKLMSELKTAFKGQYLLTIAAAAPQGIVDKCYHMADLCQIVDMVNIMGYDFYSYRDGITSPNAPICGPGSVYSGIKHYLEDLKCPANKLVLGVPFYAKTYTMVSPVPSPAHFGIPASGPGVAGPLTKSEGFLAYYETCLKLKNEQWSSGYNKFNGSYAWKGNQFASFDGHIDLVRKSCLIKKLGLRGAMFWELSYDDFHNLCGCGHNPLLTTLNQKLRCLDQDTPPVGCY